MTDLVERLRNAIHPVIQTEEEAMRMEAADEIERLRAKGEEAALAFAKRREQMSAEIERLRALPMKMTNNQDDWMNRALKLEAELDNLRKGQEALEAEIVRLRAALHWAKRSDWAWYER